MSDIIARGLSSKNAAQLVNITNTIVFAESFPRQIPESDDTARLQRAINSFPSKKKGVLWLAPIHYQITNLNIPIGISLMGSYSPDPFQNGGTWFDCTDTANPAITLNGNQKIEGISFFYPNQTWDSTNSKPMYAYPASIFIASNAKRVTGRDIFFYNAYTAIDANRAHEILILENIQGYAMYQGVIVDGSSDIDRFKTVHFNYNALAVTNDANANNYGSWTRTNGTAFKIQQADWPVLHDCFAWGYRYTYYFTSSANGVPNGVHMVSCGADGTGCAIFQNAGEGLNVVDFFFTQLNAFTAGANNSGYAIDIEAANDISFTAIRCWGVDRHAFYTNAEVTHLNGCDFREYGKRSTADSQEYRAIINNGGILNMDGGLVKGNSYSNVAGILLQHGTAGAAKINGVTFKDLTQESVAVASGTNNVNITNNIHKNCIASPILLVGGTPSNYVNTGDIKLA